MALKIYSLGNHGFVHSAIAKALGTSRQAGVIVTSVSKKDAVGVLAAHGFQDVNVNDREFTVVNDYNTVGLMRNAQVLEPGAVYVTSLVGYGPVLRIMPGDGDEFEMVGDIVPGQGRGYDQEFIVHPEYRPHQPEANTIILELNAATRTIREQQAFQRDLIADAVIANAAAAAAGVTGLSLSRIYQIHAEVAAERRATASKGGQ